MSEVERTERRRGAIDRSHPPFNVNARPARAVSRYRRFLVEFPITALDIGARGGIPVELAPLREYLQLIAMEPHAEEARRLEQRLGSLGLRSCTVIPAAAGPEGGAHTLHVTRDPGRSSLLEPNPDVVGRYGEARAYEVTAKVPLRTRALGPLLDAHAPGALDLLKLDCQGFELEVLRTLGAAQLERLLFVVAEVEFVELYRGQPLFRDVDRELAGRGFELFHLSRVFTNWGEGRWRPYGRGQLQFADAYYLRTRTEALTPDALARLIFLALYYGFADYAAHLAVRHSAALASLPGEAGAAFRDAAAAGTEGVGPARVLAGQAWRVVNKLLQTALRWRRWNGRASDHDLDYPLR